MKDGRTKRKRSTQEQITALRDQDALLDEDLIDQPHGPDHIATIDLPIMLRRRGDGVRIVIDSSFHPHLIFRDTHSRRDGIAATSSIDRPK
jgi:hypothetical protein